VPHGIFSCLDFALADRRLIRDRLTITGEGLWYELNGEPIYPLQTRRPPHKALSRGGSIGEPTADPLRVYGWLVRSLERLIEELEYHLVCTGKLSVWLQYRDGQSRAGDVRLMSPTARFDLLLDAAKRALRQAWVPRVLVNRLHLVATELRLPGHVQTSLFDPPLERSHALATLKREVNAKIGRFALRSGATLFMNEIYHDEASDYDICDVRGKLCF
jgi:hypothetical protein